jgi:protein AroM
MAGIWGEGHEVLERGALDSLDPHEFSSLAPGPGEDLFVSRLRTGQPVTLGQRKLAPLLQTCVDELEARGADVLIPLCAGTLPDLRHHRMLIDAGHMVKSFVRGLLPRGRLGILTADPRQELQQAEEWAGIGPDCTVVGASPYGPPDEVHAGAQRLWNRMEGRCDLILLECFGHTAAMRAEVRRLTGVPVVTARSVVARAVAEVLA